MLRTSGRQSGKTKVDVFPVFVGIRNDGSSLQLTRDPLTQGACLLFWFHIINCIISCRSLITNCITRDARPLLRTLKNPAMIVSLDIYLDKPIWFSLRLLLHNDQHSKLASARSTPHHSKRQAPSASLCSSYYGILLPLFLLLSLRLRSLLPFFHNQEITKCLFPGSTKPDRYKQKPLRLF